MNPKFVIELWPAVYETEQTVPDAVFEYETKEEFVSRVWDVCDGHTFVGYVEEGGRRTYLDIDGIPAPYPPGTRILLHRTPEYLAWENKRKPFGHSQTAGDRHQKVQHKNGRWLIIERTWDPNSAIDDTSTDEEEVVARLRDEKDADYLLRKLSGIDEEKFDEGVWY